MKLAEWSEPGSVTPGVRAVWFALAGAIAACGASCSGAETASDVTADAAPDTTLHDAGPPDGNDATDADAAAACPTQLDAYWSFTSDYTCDDVTIDCGVPVACRFPVVVQFSGYCSTCNFEGRFDAAACRNGHVEIDYAYPGWTLPNWCCDCPPPDAGE